MKKKISVLFVFIFFVQSIIFAEICTVDFIEQFGGGNGIAFIDYGNGKLDKQKTKSLTDFINIMEKDGWKIDEMVFTATERQQVTEFIFRK
jgi:hypothetical protein